MTKVKNHMREGYYNYMLRRYKEENALQDSLGSDQLLRTTIKEMQKEIHSLQIRVKELSEENHELKEKCQHI